MFNLKVKIMKTLLNIFFLMLLRATKEEIEIMQSGDSKSKSECIKNALSLFGE